MKAIEQHFAVMLFIVLYKMNLSTLVCCVKESLRVIIPMLLSSGICAWCRFDYLPVVLAQDTVLSKVVRFCDQ